MISAKLTMSYKQEVEIEPQLNSGVFHTETVFDMKYKHENLLIFLPIFSTQIHKQF